MALAIELMEGAVARQMPLGAVVFDACSLATDLIPVWARRRGHDYPVFGQLFAKQRAMVFA